MLRGLNFVTDLLRLYNIREILYLRDVDEPPHPYFVEAVVKLYTEILEYQATLVLFLSGSSLKRAIRSTFERDDWNGMLEGVQICNTKCTEYETLFDKDREHRYYTEQSSQIEQSIEVQKQLLELFEEFQVTRQQDRRDDKEAKLIETLASNYKSDKDLVSERFLVLASGF